VQSSLHNQYGLSSDVIPTGADTQFFSPEDHPPNPRPQVLFVGSLRSYKQPQFLLSAAARFREADFRIAGEGPLGIELARRIAREGLTNVALTGPLSAEQLRQEYRRADIFLFPSMVEGSPKVIVEAAACGLPVIVRNTYAAETVIHGVTGFQAANDDEMISLLSLLLSRPELRRQFGDAGRKHSANYDWDPITAQWEEVFADLAQRQDLRRAS
jgi:glycosyltransferase involved in cell wall biosynthesis